MKLKANGLRIEFEDTACIDGEMDAKAAKRPVVLLIMGLGMQLVAWPPQMVQDLVDAGYRVIRFDNRDIGLSTHLDAMGKPNILWTGLKFKLGIIPKPPYTLTDMAQDAIAVLEELEIDKAHIVGASMGGMIAQRVAIALEGYLLAALAEKWRGVACPAIRNSQRARSSAKGDAPSPASPLSSPPPAAGGA